MKVFWLVTGLVVVSCLVSIRAHKAVDIPGMSSDKEGNMYLEFQIKEKRRKTMTSEKACEEIRAAILNEGTNPAHHRWTMERHRKEWPTLWLAIDNILAMNNYGAREAEIYWWQQNPLTRRIILRLMVEDETYAECPFDGLPTTIQKILIKGLQKNNGEHWQ